MNYTKDDFIYRTYELRDWVHFGRIVSDNTDSVEIFWLDTEHTVRYTRNAFSPYPLNHIHLITQHLCQELYELLQS